MKELLNDDSSLIKRHLEGDPTALELLIARHLKPIYHFIYQKVGSQGDAEDLAQEVFVKVWKNMAKFDQSKAFKPWLFQIARNASIDFLRKKKSIPFSRFENDKGQNMILEHTAIVSPNLIETLNNKAVVALLTNGLSMHEQKIIQLRHEQGMTFKEMSGVFEESINTIKSRYRRILRQLKGKIQEN
jgi:RNA polymerase sigma-70 factor (ECF subfamily)